MGKESEMSQASRIKALDGLRGIAIALVICYHLGGGAQSRLLIVRAVGTVNKFGWTGVILFFVLSGFLITGILWDGMPQRGWWTDFLERRALRIFPLYYASLAVVAITGALLGNLGGTLLHLWPYALYLQNLQNLTAFRPLLVINVPLHLGHFWSLAVEEQFYLLWPWLLRLCRNRSQAKWLCLSVCLASLIYRSVLWLRISGMALAISLPTCSGALAFGGWLALSIRGNERKSLWRWAPTAAWITGILFILTAAVSLSLSNPSPLLATVGIQFVIFFFGALLILALREGLFKTIAEQRVLVWLGKISYAAYVIHVFLLGLFMRIAEGLVGQFGSRDLLLATNFVVGTTLTLLLASLSGRYFESWFLSFKRPRDLSNTKPQTVGQARRATTVQ
jgi:peptidoglycan/LPS O-acetylase OafA/YrhL